MVQSEADEIRDGILDSTLYSTLEEYKKLNRIHQVTLILAEVFGPRLILKYWIGRSWKEKSNDS